MTTKTYTAEDLGPFIKKKDNALRLIEWLMLGAPHTLFHIEHGSRPAGTLYLEDVFRGAYLAGTVTSDQVDPKCGSVCCIGGAAAQMSVGDFGSPYSKTHDWDWVDIQDEAFHFLGMDPEDANEAVWGIFEPGNWTYPPSGQKAAAALVAYSHSGNWETAIEEAEA